jgi:hypothetical protein
LGQSSRVRTLRFSASIIILAALVIACGPKPELRIATAGTSKSVLAMWLQRIPSPDSVALKGSIKIESSKSYKFGFEAFYIKPDTFNFTAKGPLGIGWIKVVLLGDSGYFSSSKEKDVVLFDKHDPIFIGDTQSQIYIPELLQALFLNFPEMTDKFVEREDQNYRFELETDVGPTDLIINRDNCLPQRQIIKVGYGQTQAKYSGWKMVNKSRVFPTRILMESSSFNGQLRLNIDQYKSDARIPRLLFRSPAKSIF